MQILVVDDDHSGSVPVLMLTAAAEPESPARAWAEGVNYYLAKPFTADEVMYLINGALGHQAPVAETRAAARYAKSHGSLGDPGPF